MTHTISHKSTGRTSMPATHFMSRESIRIDRKDGKPAVFIHGFGDTMEEAEVNARVAAAGHELLQLLTECQKEIRSAYELLGINNPERANQLLMRVDAAINATE